MVNKKNLEITKKFIVLGALSGFAFYFVITLIELDLKEMAFSFSNIARLHNLNPVFYAFDIVPIFTILYSWYVGRKYAKNLEITTKSIESEKEKSTAIIDFTENLRNGKIDIEFEVEGKDDVLGKALIDLRDNLRKSKEDELIRRKEDAQRNWATEGLAKFGEILRQDNNNMEVLSFNIISNLVKYLNANQGGFFIINENENGKYFELTACYAYDRKKYSEKTINWGEGLIGTCALEKETIFMTDVPDEYVTITSGLGDANPRCVIIVPLKLNDEIHGVIELASFKVLEKFEIDFVEKLSQSIGSTISTVKINLQTARLLKESQEQATMLAEQEDQMRQNMEELRATQEEAARQGEQFENFTNSVNHTLIRAEYDTKGILLYANTKFLNKLGYLSNREVEGQHISMFIDNKDKPWFESIWDNLAKGGKHFEGDMKHITKHGKDLWTMATYVCVRDRQGHVSKILFLGIDITEKKQQNLDYEGQIDALNRSSIKAEFTPEGDIIDCNDIFLQTMNYTNEEVKDKTVFSFIVKEDLRKFRAIWDHVVKGEPFKGQIRGLTQDDMEKWFQCTYSVVNDMYGEVAKIVFIANEITEQKRMEMESQEQAKMLKIQESELRQGMEEMQAIQEQMKKKNIEIEAEKTKTIAILEGCVEGIITFNAKGKVELFNKAAEEISGYFKEDLIGSNISKIIPFSIEQSENGNNVVFYVQDSEKREIEFNAKTEIQLTALSGEIKSILLTLTEIRTDNLCTYTAFLQNIEVELF